MTVGSHICDLQPGRKLCFDTLRRVPSLPFDLSSARKLSTTLSLSLRTRGRKLRLSPASLWSQTCQILFKRFLPVPPGVFTRLSVAPAAAAAAAEGSSRRKQKQKQNPENVAEDRRETQKNTNNICLWPMGL